MTIFRRAFIIVGVGAVLVPIGAFAQSSAPQATPPQLPVASSIVGDADTVALRKTMERIATPGEPSTARTGADAILEASSSSGKVKARFGVKVGQNFFVDSTLSGKADQATDRSALADLDTAVLSDDAEFSVGSAYTRSTATLRRGTTVATIVSLCDQLKKERGAARCSTDDEKLTEADKAQLRQFIDIGTMFSVGARLSVGRAKFAYRPTLDQASLTEHHETPVAFTATFASLLANNTFIGGQVGGESIWKGSTAQNLCTSTSVASILKCETVAIGKPTPINGFVAILEARYFFEGKHFYSNGAVAPRLEYRQSKDLKVFELPLYFLSDPDKGGWTGGVMLRVKNGDPSYVVFVGPSLPFFGF